MEYQEMEPALLAQMPVQPDELCFPGHKLIDTFGRQEREEAAARLIRACQEAGQWCGIPWSVVTATIKEEFDRARAAEAEIQAIRERHLLALALWERRCHLTFGLYRYFVPAPEREEYPRQQLPPFAGLVPSSGINGLVKGFYELVERGYVSITKVGQPLEEEEVIFPMPSLVARVVEKGFVKKPVVEA